MKKLAAVALVAMAVFGWNRFASGHRVTVTGSQVSVTAGDVKAQLVAGNSADETFVLFGDDEGVLFGDSLVSGLPIARARQLYAQYPDLGHCKSAGDAELQSQIRTVNLVAANGQIRKTLDSTRSTVKQRVGTEASRVCLTVKGTQIFVRSIEQDGAPVTLDDGDLAGHMLVQSAAWQDCSGLL